MKRVTHILGISLLLICAVSYADDANKVNVTPQDNIYTFLGKQKSKQVTLMLKSGVEVTGSLDKISQQLVHIRQLKGREYFDGIILSSEIEGVVISNK